MFTGIEDDFLLLLFKKHRLIILEEKKFFFFFDAGTAVAQLVHADGLMPRNSAEGNLHDWMGIADSEKQTPKIK